MSTIAIVFVSLLGLLIVDFIVYKICTNTSKRNYERETKGTTKTK